ncbi:MAG: hypothetical protein ACKVHP_19945 [Verrucomicrobiales bacterium]|jgi:predicted ABC-type ATPase
MPKHISIIAGPNGAGKTTFASQMLGPNVPFLNAAHIAAELCAEAPETVALRAGRLMLEELAKKLAEDEEFAIETTLSGRAYAPGLTHESAQKI